VAELAAAHGALAVTRAPRVLVLGGTGAVGGAVVEYVRELGWLATACGRRAQPVAAAAARLQQIGAPYQSIDLFSDDAKARLEPLLCAHDLVVVACEPWSESDPGGDAAAHAFEQLYELAQASGFERDANRSCAEEGEPPRRIVRIGSSAAELPHALLDLPGPGWPEDRASVEALEAVAASLPIRDHAYFRTKRSLAAGAAHAVRQGVDLVTALPTWVLSAWGDRGDEDPLRQARRTAERTGFLPAVPLNVVPAPAAAAGILLVGTSGATGERYQVAGIETDTHALHALSLGHLGLAPRPFPVPRGELEDELRLLAGRRRSSALLELWFLPWDAMRRRALDDARVEAWHVAVLLEGAGRNSDKLRSLEARAAFSGLRYPSRAEMDAQLPALATALAKSLEPSTTA
jgi:nucleoside-diphosphate-sugar epimerase